MTARTVAGSAGRPAAGDGRWWHRAACLGAPVELFFACPEKAPRAIAKAKALCAGCPVRDACLADALKAGDMHAIRGGMTWPERRAAVPRRSEWCPAGLHRRTPENTYAGGKCRPCRLAREAAARADERVARTGSSSPTYRKKAA